jgi:transcription antitermination protein NusB
MLNRRTLRVKIMQSLFAFDQCRDANFQLAHDQIDLDFQPDLNSMEVQDKELLKERRKTARQLLEKKFSNPDTPDGDEPIVNERVAAAVEDYHRQTKKDFQHLSKTMIQGVEKISELYYSALGLMTAFADYAPTDKKSDYKNYIENPWVQALRDNAELSKHLAKGKTGWAQRNDKVRGWFLETLRVDDEFKKFNELKKPTYDDQKAITKHIARKLILGKSPINSYFEEEDIYWAEDHEIVRSLMDRTIKSWKEETSTVDLQKISLDWEDDREFMSILFNGASNLEVRYKKLISKNTKNWEVDRLPLTDRIILEMPIAELITFQHIPVKVTINEYIELAKVYSTPKSRQFINGILDVIAKELSSSGDLKKSGRGLIDNK